MTFSLFLIFSRTKHSFLAQEVERSSTDSGGAAPILLYVLSILTGCKVAALGSIYHPKEEF